ncbi:hypothetical protein GUITHDRAFT_155326 [Guillardia theta CCMP2712]|uniref:Uncharacterized protein n=2 Tax=Guillardia theta TaxID=55529 RepID=L1IIN5_GUITC|nr:hypothetical protein GUITHDRAFT_155326 [Guillardia theta CCMP2712]EKX36096.1 hypothetical protein GUITHDRAFT_155326 [Guillardia theta CCMP2712]|eukprot:XP_005823076.1 hypothetical protein GUITHDRAFT_155326 [Guillardia theta CCMP2712]
MDDGYSNWYPKLRRAAMIFIAVYIVMVWLPSAYSYYFGGSYREDASMEKLHLESPDFSSINPASDTRFISKRMIQGLISSAAFSPTGHSILNLTGPGDVYSRKIVSLKRGSFKGPSLTARPLTSFVLEGVLAHVTFRPDGTVSNCVLLGKGGPALAVDIKAGVWFAQLVFDKPVVIVETEAQEPLTPSSSRIDHNVSSIKVPSFASPEGKRLAARILQQCMS